MKQADHIDTIKEMLKEFLPFTKERFGYDSYPSISFAKDTKNAADPLGKTAYYEPESKKITVYVVGRHPKDIMRSISHELVHHAQNIRGEFSQLKSFGEGYAQNDEHLREMEREAYEQGNLCFRDWEDDLKKKKKPMAGKRDKDMFNERRQQLNSALMERFGYSSKKSRIDEMMDEEGDLQVGDKVVLSNTSPPTTSGVYGTIVAINDGYVEIQSRDNERWGQQTALGGEKYRGKTHRGPISKTLKVGGPEDDWETIMYTESKKKKSKIPNAEIVNLQEGQSDLISNKILGFIAEWATYVGCTRAAKRDISPYLDNIQEIELEQIPLPFIDDKRINAAWTKEQNPTIKHNVIILFKNMVNAATEAALKASAEVGNKKLFANLEPPTSGTAAVDVGGKKAFVGIHVKFNDNTRVLGFQKHNESQEFFLEKRKEEEEEDDDELDSEDSNSLESVGTFGAINKSISDMFSNGKTKPWWLARPEDFPEISFYLEDFNSGYRLKIKSKADTEYNELLQSSYNKFFNPKDGWEEIGFQFRMKHMKQNNPKMSKELIKKNVLANPLKNTAFESQFYTKILVDSLGKIYTAPGMFIDKNGKMRRPKEVKTSFESQYSDNNYVKAIISDNRDRFEKIKDLYSKFLKRSDPNLGGSRDIFYEVLEANNIKEHIKDDMKILLGLGDEPETKPIFFFKYFTGVKNLGKEGGVEKVDLSAGTTKFEGGDTIDNLEISRTLSKGTGTDTTIFYEVRGAGPNANKIYFYIEFRLDGGGHPPQLKVGPALKYKLKKGGAKPQTPTSTPATPKARARSMKEGNFSISKYLDLIENIINH